MSSDTHPSSTEVHQSPQEEATSRTLILALIHRYSALSTQDVDPAKLAELFHPDGAIHFPGGSAKHPSEIRSIFNGNGPERLRHHVTTVDVQFTSPDEARYHAYVIAETHLKLPDHWGSWEGVVKRHGGNDGRWLFKEMRPNIEALDPDGWMAMARSANKKKEQETEDQ